MDFKSLEESLDKEFGLVNEGAFNESNVKRKLGKITKFAEKSNTKKIVVKKVEKYEDLKNLKRNRRLKKLAALVGVNAGGVASIVAAKGKSNVATSFFNILHWVIVFDSIARRVGDSVGDKGVTVGLYNEDDKLQKMYIINTDLKESEIKSFLKTNSSNDITLESAEFNMEESLELSKAIYEELKSENIEFTLQEGILEELERDINDDDEPICEDCGSKMSMNESNQLVCEDCGNTQDVAVQEEEDSTETDDENDKVVENLEKILDEEFNLN
ncbi:hypothetical protein CPT_MarsHill_158 [Staphylococcus phage MarsHill]|nr:hypothetical protein CPT_MarsHill_158 [Staphylococcus phage MarsHill]